jgi:hypothetical protein
VLGILVCGDNHFIVEGPEPDAATASALARHWSLINIQARTPPALEDWRIISRASREDLAWATIVPNDGEISSAVLELLDQLRERGIVIKEQG